MKKHKKHTTPEQVIPGVLADGAAASSHTHGLGAVRRARLRLFRIETPEEKAALQRLCSRVSDKRAFQRCVRAHLQLVASSVSAARELKAHPRPTKLSQIVKDRKRAAAKVRRFEEWLEKPIHEWPSGNGRLLPIEPLKPKLPVPELICYANYLEECAKRLHAVPRTPPRHGPRPGTRQIVDLVEFVRRMTGQHYWGSVAVLLRKSAGVGFTKKSLQELVEFHRAKARKSRVYSAIWFPHGLSKPPNRLSQ